MRQLNDFNFIKKEIISFRKKQVMYFFIILGFGILFVWIVSKILTPEQWDWYWKLSIIYFVPPAGKETIIPAGLGLANSIGIGVPLPPLIWGLSLWVFDILVCLGIITNWWLLEFLISIIPAFPFIGIRLKKKPRIYKTKVSLISWYDGLHKKTKDIEAKKYGKVLPIALFIFMFIPFQGTGAMSATIIGTWLGLKRRETVLIVAFGSFLTITFMISVSLGILKIWS
ncbi:MAG: small multi-drug export protein [Candidatus Thermoplasmatota archaeon]|nr:small multi-drug export protein [Candidatus Thermoplasmatota archaeon]